ncbi:MAG: hypothetical protein K8I82_09120 [Anaerolineae bacterium]|nr:hypothetical protein [Anaerolineae bacterium]
MLQFNLGMSSHEVEQLLIQELHKVDFIGELSLDEENFHRLNRIIRGIAPVFKHDPWSNRRVKRVPKALFAVSMVFCARYSELNARNFWTPYASLVWELESADQSFQAQCRDHFCITRNWLKENYGFYFPPEVEGTRSVVRDVYTHAIIPYYLQDDFARWLKEQDWNEILRYSPSMLSIMLRDEKRLKYVASSLKRFITDQATASVAADLIQTIATAANLYQRGTSHTEILEMLAQKPIQSTLWKTMADELTRKITRQTVSGPRHHSLKVEWGWSLDHDQMQLVINALTVNHPHPPERWVWVHPQEKPQEALISGWVTPWRLDAQRWHVEEIILADGPTPGHLYLLDEQGQVIQHTQVPSLQVEPVQAFRITRQNSIGIAINPAQQAFGEGEWLISKTAESRILDVHDHPISPRMSYPVPELLDSYGHQQAGQYALKPPLKFVSSEGVRQIEPNSIRMIETRLEGSRMAHLAKQALPIFTDPHVSLVVFDLDPRNFHRLTLGIVRGGQTLFRLWFEDLQARQMLNIKDNEVWISLVNFLEAGFSQLELRQNLQLITTSAIRLAVLPELSVHIRNEKALYTPVNPPQVYLPGITADQIQTPGTVTSEAGGVWITWEDLHGECRALLTFEGDFIPLVWDFERFYAWTEPDLTHGTLTQRQIEEAVIHIRGPRHQRFSMWVNQGYARTMMLNSKGRHDIVIMQDQLKEMLREQTDTRVSIYIEAADQQWKLFDLVRQPEITTLEVAYEPQQQLLHFQCGVEDTWQGHFTIVATPWLESQELPLAELSNLSSESLALPCSLPPGIYMLSIMTEGKRLTLPETFILVIDDGSLAALQIQPADIQAAIRWLEQDKVQQAPPAHTAPALLYLWSQYPQSQPELYQLASLPSEKLLHLPADMVRSVWQPLAALALAHDQTQWQQVYGKIPEWVTPGQCSHFHLDSPRQQIKIFAEQLPTEATTGQGFAEIALGSDLPGVRVYVHWQQQFKEKYTLQFTVPSAETADHFLMPDSDDPYFYYCEGCKRIIAIGSYAELPVSLIRTHLHTRTKPPIKKLRQLERTANLLPESLVRATILQSPSEVISPRIALFYLQTERATSQAEYPLTTRAGYENAVLDWVKRYQINPASIETLLDTNPIWRKKLRDLKQQLKQQHHGIPLLLAANQMLDVITPDPMQPLLRLDETIFLLALCLRMPLYGISQAHLTEHDLRQMVILAEQACPRLLEWALTWVEIICVQNTGDLHLLLLDEDWHKIIQKRDE